MISIYLSIAFFVCDTVDISMETINTFQIYCWLQATIQCCMPTCRWTHTCMLLSISSRWTYVYVNSSLKKIKDVSLVLNVGYDVIRPVSVVKISSFRRLTRSRTIDDEAQQYDYKFVFLPTSLSETSSSNSWSRYHSQSCLCVCCKSTWLLQLSTGRAA